MRQGIILAAMAIALSSPALAQTQFNSVCLCQYGNDPTNYSAEIALTPANRDAVRKAMEAGDYATGKIVTATSRGCEPAEWRKPRLCGSAKVTTFKLDGTQDVWDYDKIVVVGSRTLRVSTVGGLPIKSQLANGHIVLDDAKWAKLGALLVIGHERK
ncbi:MAG: hypothetical protein ACHQPH_02445 [Reyranellales bacterium]